MYGRTACQKRRSPFAFSFPAHSQAGRLLFRVRLQVPGSLCRITAWVVVRGGHDRRGGTRTRRVSSAGAADFSISTTTAGRICCASTAIFPEVEKKHSMNDEFSKGTPARGGSRTCPTAGSGDYGKTILARHGDLRHRQQPRRAPTETGRCSSGELGAAEACRRGIKPQRDRRSPGAPFRRHYTGGRGEQRRQLPVAGRSSPSVRHVKSNGWKFSGRARSRTTPQPAREPRPHHHRAGARFCNAGFSLASATSVAAIVHQPRNRPAPRALRVPDRD